MRLAIVCLAALFVLGCGNKNPGPDPTPVSSSTSSPVAPLPDAPESPLAVVLESKNPITFSGLGGGVVVADEARTTLATAAFDGELVTSPMPAGLPAEGRIVRFSGRVPNSIWTIFEEPGKPKPKNPFFRLDALGTIARDIPRGVAHGIDMGKHPITIAVLRAVQHIRRNGFACFNRHKPFSMNELAAMIRGTLDGKPDAASLGVQ